MTANLLPESWRRFSADRSLRSSRRTDTASPDEVARLASISELAAEVGPE